MVILVSWRYMVIGFLYVFQRICFISLSDYIYFILD